VQYAGHDARMIATTTIWNIVNAFRQWLSSRVRLSVRCYPLALIQPGNSINEYVCVEIVNLSSFPVTIKEVAFELHGSRPKRVGISGGACLNGKQLPLRIDPRDSVQVCYPNLSAASTAIQQSRRVIVETACHEVRFGSLNGFQDLFRIEQP